MSLRSKKSYEDLMISLGSQGIFKDLIIHDIATFIIDKELTRIEEVDFLDNSFSNLSEDLSQAYQDKRNFLNLVDIEIRKILRPELFMKVGV